MAVPHGACTVGLAVGIVFAAGLLLFLTPPVAVGSPEPLPATAGPGPSTVGLAITPRAWWMESGRNVSFAAAWVPLPSGCSAEPAWFRWSFGTGPAGGTLHPLNSSTTEFVAGGALSGATMVVVRSAAVVACASGRTIVYREAEANVSVATPVVVQDLWLTPNPSLAGRTVNLSGAVGGGEPPYSLRVAWGDGTVSSTNATGAGNFSLNHTFAAGTFRPSIVSTDSAGGIAMGSVEEPLHATDGFAAGLVPSELVTEVGHPVRFLITTVNPPTSYIAAIGCDGGAVANTSTAADGLGVVCGFDRPGTSNVTLSAVGAAPPYPSAAAVVSETVEPTLLATLPGFAASGEAGQRLYIPVSVRGGVPPFEARWTVLGDRDVGQIPLPSDGEYFLTVRVSSPGADELSVGIRDALGAVAGSLTESVTFSPALEVLASTSTTVGPSALGANMTGAVGAGVAPFDWAVVPATLGLNGSSEAGSLPSVGPFSWNDSYLAEATLVVRVVVLDGGDAIVWANRTIDWAAALTVGVTVEPGSSGSVTLEIEITGGIPPFFYSLNDSVGDVWNGSVTAPGALLLTEPLTASGTVRFGFEATDRFGITAGTGWNVSVTAPPSGFGGEWTEISAVGLGIAVASTAGATVLLRRRRRRTPDDSTMPDPVRTLRTILEPADGADRAVVELMAEEQGVPLEVVRATIDRLMAGGSIRADRGFDGEEVLSWTAHSDP